MYVTLTDLELEPFKHLEAQALEELDDKARAEAATTDLLQKYYNDLSDEEDEDLNVTTEHTVEDASDEEEEEELEEPRKAAPETEPEQQRTKRRQPSRPLEPFNPAKKLKIQYTLVTCYLSCLTLRVPILMKDLLE